jgi:hypothetical protein
LAPYTLPHMRLAPIGTTSCRFTLDFVEDTKNRSKKVSSSKSREERELLLLGRIGLRSDCLLKRFLRKAL